MIAALRCVGQFALVVALAAAVAALSNRPAYRQIPDETGVLMLTFVHAADRRAECRRLTPEEIAKLPPNMRKMQDCPRERRPLYVELDVDGHSLYRHSLPPTGIAGDGPSRVYERFVLPAGRYDVAVRMRDTARTDGFDHDRRGSVALSPAQIVVIDFNATTGDFVFR
jgi:hypothetical protein